MQIDESTLPPYLKKDIEALKAYHRGEPNPYHMGAGATNCKINSIKIYKII